MSQEPIRREAAKTKGSGWILRLTLIALFAFAAAGAAGYYAWHLRGELAALKGDATSLRGEATTAALQKEKAELIAQQLADCQASAKERNERCTKAEAGLTTMVDNLEATRTELESLRAQREQTAQRLAAFKGLTEKLKRMIDSGRLDVIVRDGRMVVKLPASVLFPSGSAELSREGELALMELAVVLRQFPDRRFMIEGHTDSRPLEAAKGESRYRDNWELSTARAVTVTRFLIEAKLPPENLIAAGHGQFDPVSNNRTPNGRQENRRIEIVLLPNIEELPPMPDTKPAKPAEPVAE
jgi:chemotaxis protein MotB